MKERKKEYYKYIFLVFIFTFLISYLIPIGGDDYGNYLTKGMTIMEKFNKIKFFYFNWEGRIFSRLFNMFLIPKPWLFCFVKAFFMSMLYYFIIKIIDYKKYFYSLIFLCIFFIDEQTFSQVYVWKTGNITYFLPMVFAIYLIYKRRFLFNNKDITNKKNDYILCFLTFIFSMFTENVSVGIIVICLLNMVFYYIKYKKIDVIFLLCLIASIIGFCLMSFSPGNLYRLSTSEFSNMKFIDKIIYNLPNLIEYTFIKNSFIFILNTIVFSLIIYKYCKKNILKIFLLTYFSVVPLITGILNIANRFIIIPPILNILLDANRWYIMAYWFGYFFLFMYVIIRYFKVSNIIYYFIILAISSNGAMMLSPVWGGRTACFTSYMLFITVLLLLKQLNYSLFEKSFFKYLLNSLVVLFVIIFTGYSSYIYYLNNRREEYINYQLENNSEVYDIIILPGYYTWNLNTWGSDGDFAHNFKKYYGIGENLELKYVNYDDVDYFKKK